MANAASKSTCVYGEREVNALGLVGVFLVKSLEGL
jgi:hypothetical protein